MAQLKSLRYLAWVRVDLTVGLSYNGAHTPYVYTDSQLPYWLSHQVFNNDQSLNDFMGTVE